MTDLAQNTLNATNYSDEQSTAANLPDVNEVSLSEARANAKKNNLPFAGSVPSPAAWRLFESGTATLVDVRTLEERKFVGYIPNSLHVAWMTGVSLNRNPRFVKEVELKVKDKSSVVLLLCRSGKRSSAAAEALTKAGFVNIFNIDEGFEGDINPANQRGLLGGWRFHSLPWVQD